MAYNAQQRSVYVPPPCPKCNGTNIATTWRESTDSESTERQWEPTAWLCRTCNG